MAETRRIRAVLETVDRASPGFLSLKGVVSGLGAAVAFLGAVQIGRVLVSGMKSAITEATDFQKEMSRVKAISGATGAAYDKLAQQSLDLGRSTVFTAMQSAEAQAEFAKAGFAVNEIYEALPGTLDLAAAGELNLGEAASITGNILRSFNLDASESGDIADLLAKAANNANTDVRGLGEAFKYAAPAAVAMGVDATDTAAAFSVLANRGIDASSAGTGLRMMMIQLVRGQGGLADLKAELFDAKGEFIGLAEALRIMEERGYGGIKAFETFDARAANAVRTLVASRAAFDESADSLKNRLGVGAETAAVKLDNLAGAWTRLEGAQSGLKIAIGSSFEPVLQAFVEGIADATNSMTTMITESESLSFGITKLGLAIIDAMKIVKSLTDAEEVGVFWETFKLGARLAEMSLEGLNLKLSKARAERENTAEAWINYWRQEADASERYGDQINADYLRAHADALSEKLGIATNWLDTAEAKLRERLATLEYKSAERAGEYGPSPHLAGEADEEVKLTPKLEELDPEEVSKAILEQMLDTDVPLPPMHFDDQKIIGETRDMLFEVLGEYGTHWEDVQELDAEARETMYKHAVDVAGKWSSEAERLELAKLDATYATKLEKAEGYETERANIEQAWMLERQELQDEYEERRTKNRREVLSLLRQDFDDFIKKVQEGSIKMKDMGAILKDELGKIGGQAISQLGGMLVNAAFEGEQAFDQLFISFMKQIAAAIAQALILKAIMAAFSGGGSEIFGIGLGVPGIGFAHGGVYGAQHGLLTGGVPGRDTIPVRAQQGELFVDTTMQEGRALLSGRAMIVPTAAPETPSAAGAQEIMIRLEMGPNLSKFADSMSAEVRGGNARLVATEITAPRSTR